MSNRDYKNFASGTIFHIYNRGNNKERIFFDDQDYRAFLFRLGLSLGFKQEELSHELCNFPNSRIRITEAHKTDFKLHAFSLMPNHFHLLIEQCSDTAISKLISKLCTSHAKYINKKHSRVGHVFQDKFKAVLIEDDPQLIWTSAYIHINSVKDGLVKNPSQYKWSSYNDYITEKRLPFICTDLIKSMFGDSKNFEKETEILSSRPI